MDQNIDSSRSDQIQTLQYPVIHPQSQKIKKPKILLQAWDKIFAIQHAQLEDSNELFQKLLEDLQIINKELSEYVNSPSRDRPIFFDDNEDHSVQYKEYLENSSKEIVASNSNQEKEKPPQDFDIRQLIREKCSIEVCEEQKQIIALNSKLLLINLNFQHLNKEKQEVKNVVEKPTERGTLHAVATILSTKEPEYSLSMGYEHPNTTPETESDEIIKFSVEELVPIPNECEVTSEDKRECDVLVCEDSSTFDVCDNHSDILSDSNNDDDISSDDDAFEDIEYVKASPFVSKLVSLEEENDIYQEEEEFYLEDIFQIQDLILRVKLLSINRLHANIKSLNENPTPDCVLNSSALIPIFEESDNSLSFSDNSSPEFETFSDHTKDAHIGYNCPSKVPVISNPEPCNNQTIDELPHTLPSFHPTFHSEAESPFTLDSTPAYVDESSNIFNPPPQTPVYPCEFYENDAYYGHYCTPPTPFIYLEPCYNQDFNFSTLAKIKDQMTSITSLCEMACQVAQQKLEEKQIEEESESLDDNIISGLSPFSAITPDEPVLSIEEPDNSLSMRDEHLDTISATESDEVIKSGVENLIPIPSEFEGIPKHVCDVPSHDNSPPLDVSTDQIKDFSESNKEFSSIDDDSFSIDDIDYVEASPFDSELVSSEVMEIVIPEVGGIDDDILLTIKDDDLREKLMNVNLLISKIKALNANPTPSSDC
nr:hypothetical protein [Tanacetum cinerariifolium]